VITLEERATEFREVVRSCSLCPLSITRTNAVPGEGPVPAEVMCIGEAPGVNEDKQGMPFVGAAGNFLTELLAAGGLKRDDVYICNVLKCRPPSNRDPLPEEIEACSEYLDLQLDMVDPRVIITLGRFSMAKWFPQQAISRIHGTVKEVDGRLIVPMYHPAAALHQGSLRQVLLDDFAKLPAILERARKLQNIPPAGATSLLLRESDAVEVEATSPLLAAAGPHPPTPSPDSASLAGEGESDGSDTTATLRAEEPSVTVTEPESTSILPSPVRHESGEGSGVRADSRADDDTPEPAPTQELTAEEEAPSAAKSGQLSLFE
jgi:DNA polymerase